MRHLIFLAVLFSMSMQSASVTVYEGARVITADGSQVIENAAFNVENGRFTQIGRAGQLNIPAGARRVALNGKTVMPAIIDTHKHLTNAAGNTREAVIDQLQRLAYYGVGVAVSLGRDRELAFQLRDQIIPNAARLRTAGRGISAPEPGRNDIPYWIKTEQEARKAIQELAAQKVDLVKIWVDDREGEVTKLSPTLYRAVIDEAHKHNLRVTAHVYTLEDAKGLLRVGLDAFAHKVGNGKLDDEIIKLFQERPNVVVVPTQFGGAVAQDEDMAWLRASIPAEELQQVEAARKNQLTDRPGGHLRQDFKTWADNLAKLRAAGVRIALGSDSGYPWAPHLEMSDMVKAGMTPAEVIVAATASSADLLRLSDAGTIRPGKSADFVVLDANPLDDIRNTRRISAVYLRGVEVDRAGLKSRSN
jgi:imidazolonepropionase-like amidohydrolase